eukprot:5541534-Prymnesium_polylepis.1
MVGMVRLGMRVGGEHESSGSGCGVLIHHRAPCCPTTRSASRAACASAGRPSATRCRGRAKRGRARACSGGRLPS